MTHGSLFSGIGGFDLAAEWMGWENKFHCEINPFGRKILNYYWPNAECYEDITKTDFTIWRGRIDVLSGGFPCQPFSVAGKRKGKDDDRYLWPEMLRAVREIQPSYIVGENVRGLVNWDGGVVFNEAHTNLEAEGYEVFPFLLPSCGINAPHERYRIWFIAYSDHKRRGDGFREVQKKDAEISQWDNYAKFSNSNESFTTDSKYTGLQRSKKIGNIGNVKEKSHKFASRFFCTAWEEFPTQPPLRSGNDGIPTGLSGITVSKHRKESIKGYGNAIVPQVVLQIFKTIEKFKQHLSTLSSFL